MAEKGAKIIKTIVFPIKYPSYEYNRYRLYNVITLKYRNINVTYTSITFLVTTSATEAQRCTLEIGFHTFASAHTSFLASTMDQLITCVFSLR